MSDIELDAAVLSDFIFVECINSDRLKAQCNYCRTVFFEGEDTDMTDSNWLVDAATHISKSHESGRKKFL